jgi:tetratricopeptide (TPR) repeat protein
MVAVVARAFCAFDEKRYADSLRLLRQAEAENHAQGFDSLGLAAATMLDDGAEALARLRTIAFREDVGSLYPTLVVAALKAIRLKGFETQSDEIAYRVATGSGFDRMDPRAQEALAYGALGHAAATGQLGQVDALLGYMRSPYAAESLLALRKFEPIWPQVEAYVGANLADVTNSYLAWTARRLADKSDDADRVSAYAEAVFWAGRYEEAAGLAEKWLARSGRDGQLEEGDGWALNIKAYALSALGRQAEADKVFDDLAKLAPAEHPWVVNFVINRQARLIDQGRWREGLAAS